MVSGQRLTITLEGGAPWGFRLQGGGNFPLEVAKIRKKSHAHDADLREGDQVLSINGVQLPGKSHQSAMDVVDMASSRIVMDIIRGSYGAPATRELDPQRQPRIIPMVNEPEKNGPGYLSKATANYSSVDGNTRRDVHTEEVQLQGSGGKKITKTVTEERITRYNKSPVMWQPPNQGQSPNQLQGQPQVVVQAQYTEQDTRLQPERSPVMWQPPSQSPVPPAGPKGWQPQHSSPVPSTGPKGWQPQHPQPVPTKPSVPPPVMPKPAKVSPVPPARLETAQFQEIDTKENLDPDVIGEQVKSMAKHGPSTVPTFSLKQFGGAPTGTRTGYTAAPQRVDDPRYPMFEAFKPSWQPSKQTKAPEPQPSMPSPQPYGGPPPQQNGPDGGSSPGYFIPPPPPMPPPVSSVPQPKKFRPGYTSTPKMPYGYDDGDMVMEHPHHPDHLPVFAPKVTICLEDDSGYPGSPVRGDGPEIMDEGSDISSLGRTKSNEKDRPKPQIAHLINFFDSLDQATEKLFSDSAFYDDPAAKYPTIDEQMNMCKLIAKSLTSAANRRAKGARMFAKRKRKSSRWVHEGGFHSEYSSSAGDVADLDDLDSELYHGEGGSKPLFSFRIPKIASQIHEPQQKMSLSKDEFERLRLTENRCEHQNVTPNMCFSIAADLHSSKNRGAKLFQKRQARSERWVIDESNARRAPPSPTKLDQVVRSPTKPSPWDAAAEGRMEAAFGDISNREMMRNVNQSLMSPTQYNTLPKMHRLTPQSTVTKLEGEDFNRKAKGWGGGSSQQQYRESSSPIPQGSGPQQHYVSASSMDSSSSPKQSVQYGDYNRRIKAWPGGQQSVTSQSSYSQSRTSHYPPQQYGMQQGGQPYMMAATDL